LEASIEELADRILAVLDKPGTLKTIVPDRPGHDRR
jgi:dTDP-glucose 4,6-dehydratase